jgi:CHAT domain-containing protein
MMLNRVPDTLAEAQLAREILIRNNEQEKLLRLDFQTAYVYNYLGDQKKSLQLYISALSTAEALGDSGQAYFGPLFTNIGGAYQVLGDLQTALGYYEKARSLFLARDEILNLVNSEINIAYIAQAQGQHRRALNLLNSILERVEGRFPAEAAFTRAYLVECYLQLNRYPEARQLAQQVVAEYKNLNDDFELARALTQLATVEAELANYEQGRAAAEQAEAIFDSLGASTWSAMTWCQLGRIVLLSGDAAFAYQKAKEAGDRFQSAGQQINLATAILLQGQAMACLGDLAASAAAGSTSLQVAIRQNVPALRYSAHLLLGQVAEQQAAKQRAMRHYQAAAATSQRVQRELTITLRPVFLENKIEAWRSLIALHLRADQPGLAFKVLEAAKSQVLLGYLANREHLRWAHDDQRSREVLEELNQLRAEHQWYYRLANDPIPDPHSQPPLNAQHARAEVHTRELRMRALTEKLYLYRAEGQAVNPAPTPCLTEIQQSLSENTLLLEYYNDGERLWVFRLDRHTIQIHPLPLGGEELTQLLAQLQINLAAALRVGPGQASNQGLTRLIRRILNRLHSALIEPIASELHGVERLFIVPFSTLHYLPFHLLYDGSSHLIERLEVVILPAAGLIGQHTPQCQPGALILAHSWDGRLPFTRIEAQTVQRIFGGELIDEDKADRSIFQSTPTQVLHIAAHGQYRLDQPDRSFLQLADGQIYADDLWQHDLSYELVTLSACETGRSTPAGNDELIGLGRGFLYAGASALVLSLWQVADEGTIHLMEVMYQALKAGASKAAALRQAQLTLLAGDPQLHPAYWGAFELVGNPDPLTPNSIISETPGAIT